jgi:putative intracellular protease/amidase
MSIDSASLQGGDSHVMRNDFVSDAPKRVLIVVANPAQNQLGWPVGFWAAELTHPYYELTERGIDVTIASPNGGKVEADAWSDPRDPSKWSAEDLISMGFLNTPELVAQLEDTPAVGSLDLDRFDAIMVAGGQSPMFTYRGHEGLAAAIRRFYEAQKPVAAYCHASRHSSTSSSATARTWSTARPSPASATSRRTTATRPPGFRSCPGGSSRC